MVEPISPKEIADTQYQVNLDVFVELINERLSECAVSLKMGQVVDVNQSASGANRDWMNGADVIAERYRAVGWQVEALRDFGGQSINFGVTLRFRLLEPDV